MKIAVLVFLLLASTANPAVAQAQPLAAAKPGDTRADCFVSTAGFPALRWVRLLGPVNNALESGGGVVVDESRRVFVSSTAEATAFDGQSDPGRMNVALFGLAPGGKREWTRLFGGERRSYDGTLLRDAAGDLYVVGTTENETLDGQTSHGTFDVLVVKYSPSGDRLWTRLIGGPDKDFGAGAVLGATGDLYVTATTA